MRVESTPVSDLVPDHDAEAVFAERLAVPLEERRVLERLVAALYPSRGPAMSELMSK